MKTDGDDILLENRGFERNLFREGGWTLFGRGQVSVEAGTLRVTDGYVTAGSDDWTDYSLEFRTRSPEEAGEVQIWAGFRHFNRDFRYVVALRGGNNNHLYLARYGAEGYDKFLDIAPLDFIPETGKWYTLKVVCAGSRIAVYLNDEEKPRLLADDRDSPFHCGGIVLGGSYLPAEFSSVKVEAVSRDALENVEKYSPDSFDGDKGVKRAAQRELYKPLAISSGIKDRCEVDLNGDWLFLPDNEAGEEGHLKDLDDGNWHVMDVPNFWVPTRAWLEGETFGEKNFNKGQNDTFHRLEEERCGNYSFDYRKTSSAWYRHILELPADIKEKKLVLHFEGVSYISTVYVNGVKLHENRGMFGPFDVDITDHIVSGRNAIALYVKRLDKSADTGSGAPVNKDIDANYAAAWDIIDSDGKAGKELQVLDEMELPRGFYQGSPGGIWKPVTLVISNKVKLEECFFVPSLDRARIDLWYSNSHESARTVEVSYEIENDSTGEILCRGPVEEYTIRPDERKKVSFSTPVVSPKLWEPGIPNLYKAVFFIREKGRLLDSFSETVGFRTVGTEGNRIMFNGKPLWIRGANHMPGHILPNDRTLADKFMEIALDHNVLATRTHCAPFSKSWMRAADEAGIMVSYEGIWPWLMLRGDDIPPGQAVDIWLDDMERLFRANRNHPSIFLWTMNNEMKFMIYSTGRVLKRKGALLNRAMKMVRELDGSRPVVADSAHFRKVGYIIPRPRLIFKRIDDGDVDDPHIYNSWYENSFYHLTSGEFSAMHAMRNRPLISQEASTGYPRAEDGLPTRVYLFEHQTPQTWVGKDAYEHSDPRLFQKRHSMLTKGTFETMRRVEHHNISGVMPFAFETWFYHHHDREKIKPMETAEKLAMAFQPVLASADLQVLHYYAGSEIKTELVLINDDVKRPNLERPEIYCEVICDGNVIVSKILLFDDLEYYGRSSRPLRIKIPDSLSSSRVDGKLVLKVKSGGEILSENSYDIVLAEKSWAVPESSEKWKIAILKKDRTVSKLMNFLGVKAEKISGLAELDKNYDTLVIGDVRGMSFNHRKGDKIKDFVSAGGKVVLLNNGRRVLQLFPLKIKNYSDDFHEIVTMNAKESRVFDGLEPLDLSWFPYKPYEKRKARLLDAFVPPYSGFLKRLHKAIYKVKVPHAAIGRYSVDRMDPDVTVLAETLLPHGYLSSPDEYKLLGGTPLFDIKMGKGIARVSSIRFDSIGIDPVAARFIFNIIKA